MEADSQLQLCVSEMGTVHLQSQTHFIFDSECINQSLTQASLSLFQCAGRVNRKRSAPVCLDEVPSVVSLFKT